MAALRRSPHARGWISSDELRALAGPYLKTEWPLPDAASPTVP